MDNVYGFYDDFVFVYDVISITSEPSDRTVYYVAHRLGKSCHGASGFWHFASYKIKLTVIIFCFENVFSVKLSCLFHNFQDKIKLTEINFLSKQENKS